MRKLTVATFLALLALLPVAAQRDFSAVQIKTTPVAGNIYMLEGSGGNIGVSAGPDGVLIVDDQFAPLADKIRTAFSTLGTGSLKFVLNTHYHGDHTGGNEIFGRDAPIIAHSNVRKRLSDTGQIGAGGWPVITFDESLSVHFNGEEIRAMHLPNGHTDGDAIMLFTASNVLHMGDHFFRDRFPYVDVDAGGNAVSYMQNVARVIEHAPADVQIIPGHGPLSGIDDLKRFHAMMEETIGAVRAGKSAGKTLAELQSAGLDSRWAEWGSGFIDTGRWIEIIFRSLD